MTYPILIFNQYWLSEYYESILSTVLIWPMLAEWVLWANIVNFANRLSLFCNMIIQNHTTHDKIHKFARIILLHSIWIMSFVHPKINWFLFHDIDVILIQYWINMASSVPEVIWSMLAEYYEALLLIFANSSVGTKIKWYIENDHWVTNW